MVNKKEEKEKKTVKKSAKKKVLKTKKVEKKEEKKPVEVKEEKPKKQEASEQKTEEKKVEEKPKKKVSRKKKKDKLKSIVARGKRKKAIARASIKAGRGNLRINKRSVNSINNVYVRELVLEPVKLAGEKALKVDIFVNVHGGGALGQAQASRTAIARALVDYFTGDESLKKLFLDRDRSLLVEDSRRVESKKFKGPKARARYQKSYR